MSWTGETRQYKGTGDEMVSSESRMREQMASRQSITSEKQWNYLASCHFSNRGCGGQFKLFAMLSHFYFEEVILMLICYFWLEKGMATTPVFLPGEFHGQRNLVGYSPRGHRESDNDWVTKHTHSVRSWFSFMLLHVGIQFSHYNLLKRLSLLYCVFLLSLL